MKIRIPLAYKPLFKRRVVPDTEPEEKKASGGKRARKLQLAVSPKLSSILFGIFTLLPIVILILILLKLVPGTGTNPSTSPSPEVEGQSQPSGEPGKSDDSGEKEDGKKTSDKKCCTDPTAGEQIGYPGSVECVQYGFDKTVDNLEAFLAEADKNGLKLVGIPGQTEFNGYVSSVMGLDKYAVYLYSQDALNYEYDPPYRYKATECTEELKQKLVEAFEAVK